jgi:anti-sigma B factor antagonist
MFRIETQNNIQIIHITDLLAALDNNALLQAAQQSIEQGHRDFIINLEAISYMSSMGLNLLIGILTRARNAGGEVILVGLSDRIQQLLVLTRLRNTFTICNSISEALEQYNSVH